MKNSSIFLFFFILAFKTLANGGSISLDQMIIHQKEGIKKANEVKARNRNKELGDFFDNIISHHQSELKKMLDLRKNIFKQEAGTDKKLGLLEEKFRNEFSIMEKEMNDIFRRFQSRIGLHPYNEINPRIETKETDKSYEVTIEMPGLNKEDINVKIIDNQINIIGKRKQAMEESKGEAILSEFFYGEYRRIISLEKEVEPNSLNFSYTSGLVTIKLNKKKD